MNVYVVTERYHKKAYNAEPWSSERIIKVLDDYHKVVNYICECIREDHNNIDETKSEATYWCKYEPNPNTFREGYFIESIEYRKDNYHETHSYRFKSYDVE